MAKVSIVGQFPYTATVKPVVVVDGEEVGGYIIRDTSEIAILKAEIEKMRYYAMHEISHGVLDTLDLTKYISCDEEDFVLRLSQGFYATLAHTRWTHRGRLLLPTFGEGK